MEFSVRAANVQDCQDIARLSLELNGYLKITEEERVTLRDLEQDGFSENPLFHAIIAEVPEQHKSQEGHTKIGYALYFYSYDSRVGKIIYMGELYVMPEFRGKGIGKALISNVAQLGLAAGCHKLTFTVRDWNKLALDFYLSQGCFNMTASVGIQYMCCKGEELKHLANRDTTLG